MSNILSCPIFPFQNFQGLALQLYAFSRFSSSFPESPQLQALHLEETSNLGIFLATEQLPEEVRLRAASSASLTLAAFGETWTQTSRSFPSIPKKRRDPTGLTGQVLKKRFANLVVEDFQPDVGAKVARSLLDDFIEDSLCHFLAVTTSGQGSAVVILLFPFFQSFA